MQGMARVAWLSFHSAPAKPSVLQHASMFGLWPHRDVGRTREHQEWPISSLASVKATARDARRAGFSALMVHVHLTSPRLQSSTKTPLCGTKERLLRTKGGLAAASSGDPQSMRVTRAPEALRPLRRIPKNRTGEGWSLAHANADADAGATTPSACNCNTSNAGAVPRHEASPCLRTAQAWRCARCVCGVVVVVRRRARVERASQRRLSLVAAQ